GWFAVVIGTLQATLRPEDHGGAVVPGLRVPRPGPLDHGPGIVLRTGPHHAGEEDRAFDLDLRPSLAGDGAVASPVSGAVLGHAHSPQTARGDQLSDLNGVQGRALAQIVTGKEQREPAPLRHARLLPAPAQLS